jgi:hypothetical protein
MTEAPLTRAECLAACKRFVGLGLQYSLQPVLSSPYSGATWCSKVEVDTDQLSDMYNVGVRGGESPGGSLTAFGIRVEDDYNMQIPLRDLPVYKFLRDFGTLRFEAGSVATFVFKCDRFCSISETQDYRERIYPEPLKGATIVSETGWVGWGVMYDERGRSAVVTCEGAEPLNVRAFPVLVDALRKTGRFRVSASDAYVGEITGPPLL